MSRKQNHRPTLDPEKKIRVARTVAQFTTGLYRILREHLGLTVTKHEHWEFEEVADWTQMPQVKEPGPFASADEFAACTASLNEAYCSEYQLVRYIGIGDAGVRRTDIGPPHPEEKIGIRTLIEKIRWVSVGPSDYFYYLIHIWVRFQSGEVRRSGFVLWNDTGKLYADEHPVPKSPPRRIAFWHEQEPTSNVA